MYFLDSRTMSLDERWKLIQRLSLLAYVHRGEESKDLYKTMILAKIFKGFYDDCKKDDPVQVTRDATILTIAKYVKDHPRATEREIQLEVERQINLFAEKINEHNSK